MMKRYAPHVPDSKWHRPGDTDYLRELLAAAGLSQRKAGPLLGMNERTMRLKVGGQNPLSYAEQYCLEVLADAAAPAAAVGERAPSRDDRCCSSWYQQSARPITTEDAGKLVIGFDAHGAMIAGELVRDGFDVAVRAAAADALDARVIAVSRLATYALLDPPQM